VKFIDYAGGEYLTGDDIALALLDYSEALADAGTAASIEIPIRAEDGSLSSATFLVGPSSQIVARSARSSEDELLDDLVVARLRALTRRLHPAAFIMDEDSEIRDDYDSE
jgi:hypothetical protein